MPPSPEQRRVFGQRLAALREDARTSQRAVGAALPVHGGTSVTGSAVSEWERGISAPDPQNTRALELLFDEPEGGLGGLLGYRGDAPTITARLAALEDLLSVQQRDMRRLFEHLGLVPGNHDVDDQAAEEDYAVAADRDGAGDLPKVIRRQNRPTGVPAEDDLE